mmetsp:Transcript_68681/g.173035  ORF Transcript_68681/g.173035 Transcript_68681/m.173035 type:complete len:115 (-) Transcript_68681:161-505(-)
MSLAKSAVVFAFLLAATPALTSARSHLRQQHGLSQPGTATAMAGLEGEACPPDEFKRYHEIVCKIEKACGCADTVCELDWCSTYVHEWKKDFGACLLKGCDKKEKEDDADDEGK